MFQIHPSNPALLATISVVPVLLYWYYSKSGSKKPRLHCVKSAFTDYVAKRCLQLDRPFEPTSWACNRHLQTLVGSLQPRAVVQWSREYVDLPDGGCCALDWGQLPANDANPASTDGECTENMPVFIALPGLTGDAQSMSHLCKRALSRGYRPVVFNKRGHGGSKLTTPKLQSFGDPEDFRVVVKHVQSKYPHCTLTALGSSAGSGLLASYLGEYGTDCILSFAVFVSPGYDAEFMFNNCIEHPYDFLLMSMLKKLLNNNREMLAQAVDMDRLYLTFLKCTLLVIEQYMTVQFIYWCDIKHLKACYETNNFQMLKYWQFVNIAYPIKKMPLFILSPR